MSATAPEILQLTDELSDLNLGDARLNKRACQLIETLGSHPDRSIPTACGGWDEAKAAYRLFDSKKVTAQKLLAPHTHCTVERMMQHDTVLAIQDTTELDYTGKDDIEGLGTLNYEQRKGLYLHPTLAITPQRIPLGILDYWSWTRPFEDAETESIRWLEGYQRLCEQQQHIWQQAFDTRLVYMADREGDLFDIYAEHRRLQKQGEQAADFLIRAQHNRILVSDQHSEESRGQSTEKSKLWPTIEASPKLGQIEFKMPSANKRKGRVVQQSLQAARVTIVPPAEHKTEKPVELTAILAREINPPEGEEAIEWMLLTNLEIHTQLQAEEMLSWYLSRWQIEILFRILKSGCKIEELQLEKIERLEPAITLYLLIAWRVLYCTMIGRECPELPCDLIFGDDEWRAAYILAKSDPPPEQPPTINEMIRIVAGFGGFLNRKGDGFPGPQTIWIGMQRTKDFAMMYKAMRKME
ncbi:MAG: IS4 family transposase [Gammaproteobacteria bacterium]|nr:IS4 family transposase [Gammaproteobacteria bacterium]